MAPPQDYFIDSDRGGTPASPPPGPEYFYTAEDHERDRAAAEHARKQHELAQRLQRRSISGGYTNEQRLQAQQALESGGLPTYVQTKQAKERARRKEGEESSIFEDPLYWAGAVPRGVAKEAVGMLDPRTWWETAKAVGSDVSQAGQDLGFWSGSSPVEGHGGYVVDDMAKDLISGLMGMKGPEAFGGAALSVLGRKGPKPFKPKTSSAPPAPRPLPRPTPRPQTGSKFYSGGILNPNKLNSMGFPSLPSRPPLRPPSPSGPISQGRGPLRPPPRPQSVGRRLAEGTKDIGSELYEVPGSEPLVPDPEFLAKL